MQTNDFRPAERVNRGLVSVLEQRVLIGLARHLPEAVRPDHLTALGFGSLLAVGFSYWYARYSTGGLWLVILFLALNWFGDSLDGTLARVRGKQRPRYGFYVDHVLDACGSVFLFGGLALSGYMSERIAVGLLVAGNIALLRTPYAMLGGKQYLLFDVGGAIGIGGWGVGLGCALGQRAGQ